jgi:hypothetical protein
LLFFCTKYDRNSKCGHLWTCLNCPTKSHHCLDGVVIVRVNEITLKTIYERNIFFLSKFGIFYTIIQNKLKDISMSTCTRSPNSRYSALIRFWSSSSSLANPKAEIQRNFWYFKINISLSTCSIVFTFLPMAQPMEMKGWDLPLT